MGQGDGEKEGGVWAWEEGGRGREMSRRRTGQGDGKKEEVGWGRGMGGRRAG